MRKQPSQRRAVFLVDSLVDAAAQLVVRDGLDALTTVAIAERAGVSVGSLYQYFASKEELVQALADRVTADFIAALDRVAGAALKSDPEPFMRALLEASCAVLEQRDGLARELLRHWNRLDTLATLHRLEQRMLELLRTYALMHVHSHRIDPSPVRAFVLFNSVVFTVLRSLSLPNQAAFTESELMDELVTLSARLLVASPAGGVTPEAES